MINSALRNSFIISLFGHMAVFSIFSLSFGTKVPEAKYPYTFFWGRVLPESQVAAPCSLGAVQQLSLRAPKRRSNQVFEIASVPLAVLGAPRNDVWNFYVKPQLSLAANREKTKPHIESSYLLMLPHKKEQDILFHPLLPGGFAIYFRDRLIAHVELKFNIITGRKRNSISVKRKISSGNLEVDLLSKRYIERYLYIQQAAFTPNSWQTVKIDLSAKEH